MRAGKGSVHTKRRKKILKAASGFRGGRHRLYKTAKQAVMKAGMHAFASRRQKKRQLRALWIARINAAARLNDISYSRLIDAMNKSDIEIDRKSLADLAVSEPQAFSQLVAGLR